VDVNLAGINILIIGGDKREVKLYFHLKKIGASICMYGFEKYQYLKEIKLSSNLIESVSSADVIITPLTGIEKDGKVYAPYAEEIIYMNKEALLKAVNPGTLFIAGYVYPGLKKSMEKAGMAVCETREMDEISILNAIPTAEGAIQVAMANTDITIHNSHSIVLGFGRCGSVIAHTLKALGAEVTVAVRRPEVLAWVEAFKMRPLPMSSLAEEICRADIIFNTIPALVIDAEVIHHIKSTALIVDIASYPGGVDTAVAERLNIKAVILPGLPGKVAPKTAGKILCKVYPRLIISFLKGGK